MPGLTQCIPQSTVTGLDTADLRRVQQRYARETEHSFRDHEPEQEDEAG